MTKNYEFSFHPTLSTISLLFLASENQSPWVQLSCKHKLNIVSYQVTKLCLSCERNHRAALTDTIFLVLHLVKVKMLISI